MHSLNHSTTELEGKGEQQEGEDMEDGKETPTKKNGGIYSKKSRTKDLWKDATEEQKKNSIIKKGIYENFEFFLDAYEEKFESKTIKEGMEKYGLAGIPSFAKAMYGVYLECGKEKEFEQDLKQVMVGVDNLHNIRGWMLFIIGRLKETNRLNDVEYEKNLQKFGLTTKDSNGSKVRKLLLNFESIIIPALVKTKHQLSATNSLTKILSILRVISWISYSPVQAQTFQGIRLLLHYKCFELSLALQDVPADLKLIDLYVHVILCHFPSFFDKYSFQTTSTEYLEYLFVTVKRAKHTTRRNKKNVMKVTFGRFQTQFLREICFEKDEEKVLDAMIMKPSKKNLFEDEFTKFREILMEIEDIKIKMPNSQDDSCKAKCTKAFIQSLLSNQNYNLNDHFENGTLTLKVSEDLKSYLRITQPKANKN